MKLAGFRWGKGEPQPTRLLGRASTKAAREGRQKGQVRPENYYWRGRKGQRLRKRMAEEGSRPAFSAATNLVWSNDKKEGARLS